MAETRHPLKARREALSRTQQQMADAVGVPIGTYRDWEQGRCKPSAANRPDVAAALDVSLETIDAYFNEISNGHAIPTHLTLYASLEREASCLWTWQPVTVHALLQTPAYAAAVERLGGMSDDGVAQRVKLRQERQAVLRRTPNPLQLHVVLDESVLLRATGSRQIMAEQLEHLVELAERPHIHLRVLPMASGVQLGGDGPFTVLASVGAVPQVVCLVSRVDIRYVESRDSVTDYTGVYERLARESLDELRSIERIKTIVKEHYQ